jgi:hypothetical protein
MEDLRTNPLDWEIAGWSDLHNRWRTDIIECASLLLDIG